MSKTKKKTKNGINRYLIPVFILIVIIASALFSFGNKMLNESKTQVVSSYSSIAAQVAALYEKEIYTVTKTSQVIADVAGESEDLFCDENKALISKMAEDLSVANVYLVKPDYSAIDVNGNQFVSITELPGYEGSFKGTSTVSKFIKNMDKEDVLLVSIPIATKTEIKGYILSEYVPLVASTITEGIKYPAINTYALASAEGLVVETGGAECPFVVKGSKIYELTGITYKKGNASSFKQNFTLLRNGYVEVSNNSRDEYLFVYPVSDYKACAIVGVESKFVDSAYAAVSKNIRNMLFTMAGIIGAFLLGVIVVIIFNKAKYNMENEDLQNKADTDQLTDLYNKMATERLIKEYLEGEGRDKVSMLFVLDVDNFKKINDTMGHAFGDEVLQSLGHQIRAWFRVNDIVGRIGGDEFMVFIKDIKDEAVIRREGSRIMQFFEGFTVGDYTKYSPTASVGGAVYPNDATDFESLYKAADKAVYKSKKGGKNRVSLYGDLDKVEQDTEPDKTGRD